MKNKTAPEPPKHQQDSTRSNRRYRDSVFCSYMSEDVWRLLEVGNAVLGTSYPPETEIEINTLSDVLFMERVNDISFILNNQHIVLLEQQSTINENMPLRMLLYITRLYEKALQDGAIYKENRIPLFTPRFVMFYNGGKKTEEYRLMKLSESYIVKEQSPGLELEVELYNICYREDCKPAILQQCDSLRQYSQFVGQVEENRKKGMPNDKAIQKAMEYCIANGIMAEYLKKHGAEVLQMLMTEWNWDDAKEVWQEEAYHEGKAEGRAEEKIAMVLGLNAMQVPIATIAKAAKVSVEQVQQWIAENKDEVLV